MSTRTNKSGVVFFKSFSGHRQSYSNIFGRALDFEVKVENGSLRDWVSLILASHTIFGSIDDHYFKFIVISIVRALLFKTTKGLFLRPQSCYEGNLKGGAKFSLFWTIKWVPFVKVFTIVPHKIRREYRHVANGWVVDPQVWDLQLLGKRANSVTSELSESVRIKARGRTIIGFFGSANRIKGFIEFVEFVCANFSADSRFQFVLAGKVSGECQKYLANLAGTETIIANRYVTDRELSSLYGVVDFVWARYSPDYDQASGIFGRAIQFGVVPLVRSETVIADFASEYDFMVKTDLRFDGRQATNETNVPGDERLEQFLNDFVRKLGP